MKQVYQKIQYKIHLFDYDCPLNRMLNITQYKCLSHLLKLFSVLLITIHPQARKRLYFYGIIDASPNGQTHRRKTIATVVNGYSQIFEVSSI